MTFKQYIYESKKDIMGGLKHIVELGVKRKKEMINVINHLTVDDIGDDQYSDETLQRCLENWFEKANENIAFNHNVPDDNIPDYEADLNEIYDYMERQLNVLFNNRFRNNPKLKNELAPTLDYSSALEYVNEYFKKWYPGEVFE